MDPLPTLPNQSVEPKEAAGSPFNYLKMGLLLILVLCVGIGIGWYLAQDKQDVAIEESPSVKTYTNTRFGFQFEYPVGIKITEKLVEDLYLNPEDPTDRPLDFLQVYLEDTLWISVNHPDTGYGGWLYVSESVVEIGGVSATKTIMKPDSEEGSSSGEVLVLILFKKDGDSYMLTSNDEAKADQILSTFKFMK